MIHDGLTRRVVLERLDDGSAVVRCGSSGSRRELGDERPPPPPGLLKRIDARTRSVLTGAVVAAVLVNAGAVWAYWHITGSGAGRANAGTAVELNLRGRSDLNKPLVAGANGDLIVTVTNEHDFPIRVTSVSPGAGNVVADDEHRDAGCLRTGVVFAKDAAAVRWDVDANHVSVFTVPGGLARGAASDPACAGAVFTAPVLANGVVRVSSGR